MRDVLFFGGGARWRAGRGETGWRAQRQMAEKRRRENGARGSGTNREAGGFCRCDMI